MVYSQITMAPTDSIIGYLPLAHIFEMICEINALGGGSTFLGGTT